MAKEEQGLRVEITTFKEVKDLSVNPSKSFKTLVIDDPKDIEMSDQDATYHSDNSTPKNKAEAMGDSITKANPGSNMSQLASPLLQIKISAAEVNKKEKEDTGQDSEEVEIEDAVEEVDRGGGGEGERRKELTVRRKEKRREQR